jgi:hypothetical protein
VQRVLFIITVKIADGAASLTCHRASDGQFVTSGVSGNSSRVLTSQQESACNDEFE